MSRLLGTILVASATICAFSACQSKFNDKAPGAATSLNANKRIVANEELDRKLGKLESYTERVRQLLRAVRRVQGARVNQDVYTQLDFMMDLNAEIKKTAAENFDNKQWIKHGAMKLNVKGVSEDCQNVKTMLRAIEQKLLFSVQTCRSGDKYLEVLVADLAENKLALKFNNANIQAVLQDTVVPAIAKETDCEVTTDSKEIVATVQCTGLTTQINASESLVINSLRYDRFADLHLQLDANIFENGEKKGLVKFTVDSKGKTTFNAEKTK